jgi:hypothetical protein
METWVQPYQGDQVWSVQLMVVRGAGLAHLDQARAEILHHAVLQGVVRVGVEFFSGLSL